MHGKRIEKNLSRKYDSCSQKQYYPYFWGEIPRNMNSIELNSKLNERVKELSCLYALSELFSEQDQGFEHVFEQAIKVIPTGWQLPQKLNVYLNVDQFEVGQQPAKNEGQQALICIEGKDRGVLKVWYPNDAVKKIGYLKEEQALLNQIARQIGTFYLRIEQKEKEKLVQERMKNEDRLNILAELTAGVAHELNTPLGNILGYAELLKKAVTNKAHQKDLDKIIKSALNAREIVKKLMYFSCEMPTQFNYVDIEEIIKSSIDLLKLRLQEKNIRVKYQREAILNQAPNMLRKVRGDELQLSQVFINLIMNAANASPKGSTIYISSRTTAETLNISIIDQGEGIRQHDLQRIFQPFFTTRKGGTGLGLPVVHGIIQNHGGKIKVESEWTKGSVFTIELPIA